MRIKGITDEDFVNYRRPSMYICTSVCDFKCEKECGQRCCQNSDLAKAPSIIVEDDVIIERYISNDITHAVVIGGLEPFDQFEELIEFVNKMRTNYHCMDDIVIYTGYYPDEIKGELATLSYFPNVIVKFGRYIPGQSKKYDDLLHVWLASPNQYSEMISK